MRAPSVVQSMGFDRWMGSRTHLSSIVQNSSTALKILRAPPTHSPLPTSPWQPLIFFLSLVLTFSECHRVGGIQLIAFSYWLLSLSNMHLSLLYVFWFNSSLLLVLNSIPSSGYSTIYLSIHILRHILVASSFDNYN